MYRHLSFIPLIALLFGCASASTPPKPASPPPQSVSLQDSVVTVATVATGSFTLPAGYTAAGGDDASTVGIIAPDGTAFATIRSEKLGDIVPCTDPEACGTALLTEAQIALYKTLLAELRKDGLTPKFAQKIRKADIGTYLGHSPTTHPVSVKFPPIGQGDLVMLTLSNVIYPERIGVSRMVLIYDEQRGATTTLEWSTFDSPALVRRNEKLADVSQNDTAHDAAVAELSLMLAGDAAPREWPQLEIVDSIASTFVPK